MAKDYEASGVSLEAGYESVKLITKHIKGTNNLGVMGSIGGFGGMFDLSKYNVKEPVLVSGTDGVGTKLLVAIAMDKHDTIGQDVVAMCVNDILAQGAKPLYFLDYIAVGKNIPLQIEQIVKGVADGCKKAGCALVGGETAEMPDMYSVGHYDIAGYTTGVVEKSKIITNDKVVVGDKLIGIGSSGVHSNGFSLIRKIFFKDNDFDLFKYNEVLGAPLGETLLTPTNIYVKSVLDVIENIDVHGVAHITGGGFDENIPRILKQNQGIQVYNDSFVIPPIFKLMEDVGGIKHRDMFNIFNMGIGMVLIVKDCDVDSTISILKENGEKAYLIGEVTDKKGVVIL